MVLLAAGCLQTPSRRTNLLDACLLTIFRFLFLNSLRLFNFIHGTINYPCNRDFFQHVEKFGPEKDATDAHKSSRVSTCLLNIFRFLFLQTRSRNTHSRRFDPSRGSLKTTRAASKTIVQLEKWTRDGTLFHVEFVRAPVRLRLPELVHTNLYANTQ